MTVKYNAKVSFLDNSTVYGVDNKPEGFMSVFIVSFCHGKRTLKSVWVPMAISTLGDELNITNDEIVDNALIMINDQIEELTLNSWDNESKREREVKALTRVTENFHFSN